LLRIGCVKQFTHAIRAADSHPRIAAAARHCDDLGAMKQVRSKWLRAPQGVLSQAPGSSAAPSCVLRCGHQGRL